MMTNFEMKKQFPGDVFNRRKQFIQERFDRIIESRDDINYSEFVGSTGGDILVFRVYGDNESNFKVCER